MLTDLGRGLARLSSNPPYAVVVIGEAFGAEGEVDGEVCFNTSMTGYQEILTDPSYTGQIVTMTYPLIGNYGINSEDVESRGLFLKGFVIRELCEIPSNYRSQESLDHYLRRNRVIGLQGIDTRALVRLLRTQGALRGVLSTVDLDDQSLLRKVAAAPGLVGRDLVREVMPQSVSGWSEGLTELGRPSDFVSGLGTSGGPHVVAIDYGMKWNISRYLRDLGCRVTVVPGSATASE
ncbi:MAG: carbamoyl-phosphate synthase domain-containing protein, partial [Planctomycetaceae bacterium]